MASASTCDSSRMPTSSSDAPCLPHRAGSGEISGSDCGVAGPPCVHASQPSFITTAWAAVQAPRLIRGSTLIAQQRRLSCAEVAPCTTAWTTAARVSSSEMLVIATRLL
jgi:hypothetical protein